MAPTADRNPLAIVGGGISGIAAALDLARSGRFSVTLFEKEERLGGLCSSYTWRGTSFDKYYHVILPADANTISLVEDFGLGGELQWRPSRSGFLGGGRLVPFASAGDFIRFPFLSLREKIRLGLGIISVARCKSSRSLDTRTAPDWLKKVFGPAVYAKFWEPLLWSKLGEARDRTPARFMEATIKRLFGARGKSSGREHMGCVRGGYAPLLRAATEKLRQEGVAVKTGTAVLRIVPSEGSWHVDTANGRNAFGRVLMMTPLPEALAIIPKSGLGDAGREYWDRLNRVEYLGVVCVVAFLRRSLSPYYVINLLDLDLPFTGVIESTNVLGPENAGGYHLVYLPKYATQDDPLLDRPDKDIESLFLGRLHLMFPELSRQDIVHVQTFRSRIEQPLPSFGPSLKWPGGRTPLPGLYLAGTAFIEDATVNNDAAIRIARETAAAILADAAKDQTSPTLPFSSL